MNDERDDSGIAFGCIGWALLMMAIGVTALVWYVSGLHFDP